MKLNEALDLLQKNGAKVKSLNETTAITAFNYLVAQRIYDALDGLKQDCIAQAEEEPELSGEAEKIVTAIDNLENMSEKEWQGAVDEFLAKIGLN